MGELRELVELGMVLGLKMLLNMVAERRFSRRELREKWDLAPLRGPGPL